MNFAAATSKLNIRIGDTDNFTFTPEEKIDALTEAFNDSHVLKTVWNSTTVYATGTYEYPLPSEVTVVQDVYTGSATEEPKKVGSTEWEIIGSNIRLGDRFTNGSTISLKGYVKYLITDTVTEVNIQEYILNLAQLKLLRMLGVKKSLRFLKNDTSMSEVIAIKQELEREVKEYQRRLPRAWENA